MNTDQYSPLRLNVSRICLRYRFMSPVGAYTMATYATSRA